MRHGMHSVVQQRVSAVVQSALACVCRRGGPRFVKRVDDLRSDGTHGSVAVLRNVLQHVEGADRVDLEMVHQNALAWPVTSLLVSAASKSLARAMPDPLVGLAPIGMVDAVGGAVSAGRPPSGAWPFIVGFALMWHITASTIDMVTGKAP
jgi:hypothetical protein